MPLNKAAKDEGGEFSHIIDAEIVPRQPRPAAPRLDKKLGLEAKIVLDLLGLAMRRRRWAPARSPRLFREARTVSRASGDRAAAQIDAPHRGAPRRSVRTTAGPSRAGEMGGLPKNGAAQWRWPEGRPRSRGCFRVVVGLSFSKVCRKIVSTMGGIFQTDGGRKKNRSGFAAQSLPASLKLMEVLARANRRQETAAGHSSYALGFVETPTPSARRSLSAPPGTPCSSEAGSSWRWRSTGRWTGSGRAGAARESDAGNFWPHSAWGLLNLAFDKTGRAAQLPRVEAMMKFVAAADRLFFHGGPCSGRCMAGERSSAAIPNARAGI
jgi:hypothetical protein